MDGQFEVLRIGVSKDWWFEVSGIDRFNDWQLEALRIGMLKDW